MQAEVVTVTAIDMLRPAEAARRLGLSVFTINRLRKRGEFVPAVKVSRGIIGYRVSDLDKWLEAHKAS
jgi:predicted DNA-binding transcriptional regulator AlpA